MTGIVSHKYRRIGWRHSRHSYLVDLGNGIEIRQIAVSDLFENQLVDPPFPETRYFEVEIDEVRKDGQTIVLFQNIYPVRAKRKPDWHLLKFRIRRGSWTITERIHSLTEDGEIQWLYTNDFNILFLSSGGRYDQGMLLDLITSKLDKIACSIREGSRIPSEFENQLACRTAFGTIFSEGIDGAFRNAVIYQDYAAAVAGGPGRTPPHEVRAAITSNHGRATVSDQQAAELHVDLTRIDDLKDLSWLVE